MNNKILLLSLLSIAQSNFGMDVVPEPELVQLDDGHEWTLIRKNNPEALVPFFELMVAWRSDDIPDKGMKLEEHPNHGFGVVMIHFDSIILHRSWPHLSVDLSQVPLIAMRLLTCKEARSWLQCPLIGLNLKWTTENLIPSERIKYLRGRAFERCCPEKNASERKDEAICLLALRKRKGNLVAQCPKEIVRLIADPLFDAWVHKLQANKDPEMLPGAQLVFE